MKNGLKLYGRFDRIYLEVCITDKDKSRFEALYSSHTGGMSAKEKQGYCKRMLKNQQNAWGIEYRIYFETQTPWVISSLNMLGYYVEQKTKNIITPELNKAFPNHGYKIRVASADLFWKLVDYGYRLGENSNIPFDHYEMMKTLEGYGYREPHIVPCCDIRIVEADNPIEEAQFFLKANQESTERVEEPVLV